MLREEVKGGKQKNKKKEPICVPYTFNNIQLVRH